MRFFGMLNLKYQALKPILLTLTLLVIVSTSFSQRKSRPMKVGWFDWYDSAAFYQGPEPLVTGYGYYSDSLSLHYDRIMFEHEGMYYPINCLADYYFWFTRKYEFLFRHDISVYEDYYYSGDSYRLAEYVKKSYKGKKLPIKFRFPTFQNFYTADPAYKPTNAAPPTVVRFRRQ